MSRKSIIFLALLIISPIIIYIILPSDESRIRKLFREGAHAVEEKKQDEVMSKVSFNYTDEHGLSYLILKDGVQRVFKDMTDIKVEYDINKIQIKDDKASAEIDIRVTAAHGQDAGYAVGDAAKPAHIKFFLEKERTKWLIVKTEGLPQDF